jgi:glucosylceramidase
VALAALLAVTAAWWVGAVGDAAAIADPWHTSVVETTANLSLRLTERPAAEFQSAVPYGLPVVEVNDGSAFQQVTGFGAALTDSAAWLIHDKLGAAARTRLMRALFGRGGAHIGVVRVPMGASDFTAGEQPYSYDDMPPGRADPELRHFSIAHDLGYIIPTLRQMLSINPNIKIIASPWSPPGWMKANDALDNIGHRGTLLPRFYHAWAEYFVKFIRAYQRAGVHVSAVTPQNEPGGPFNFPGMELPARTEKLLVAKYLRPALRAAGLPTKIYGGEEGWNSARYEDSLVRGPYRGVFDGISWHCYGGIPSVMSRLHGIDPAAYQIENECAPSDTSYSVSEILIGSMRNWASAAELWNIALNPYGGPVQPPNYGCGGCRGLVTIGRNQHVAFRTDYYQLAQISKFVQPGALRVASNNLLRYFDHGSHYGAGAGLDNVAFRNPDGSLVLDAYNNTRRVYRFAISWHGRYLPARLSPHATATFIWNSTP